MLARQQVGQAFSHSVAVRAFHQATSSTHKIRASALLYYIVKTFLKVTYSCKCETGLKAQGAFGAFAIFTATAGFCS